VRGEKGRHAVHVVRRADGVDIDGDDVHPGKPAQEIDSCWPNGRWLYTF
jgi:hypothetical protein